jgi:hypothetical protein
LRVNFRSTNAIGLVEKVVAVVGDVDHLKVFASQDVADAWFKENDLEGVAFEYEVLE